MNQVCTICGVTAELVQAPYTHVCQDCIPVAQTASKLLEFGLAKSIKALGLEIDAGGGHPFVFLGNAVLALANVAADYERYESMEDEQ